MNTNARVLDGRSVTVQWKFNFESTKRRIKTPLLPTENRASINKKEGVSTVWTQTTFCQWSSASTRILSAPYWCSPTSNLVFYMPLHIYTHLSTSKLTEIEGNDSKWIKDYTNEYKLRLFNYNSRYQLVWLWDASAEWVFFSHSNAMFILQCTKYSVVSCGKHKSVLE